MNPRTTGLLALVALVLGAFVYFHEIAGEGEREAAKEAEKRLFPDVEASAIDSVELTTKDGVSARFERREGAWKVVSPVDGPGDATALDGLASAVATLPRAGTVKSAPGDLGQFGLGPEAQVLRFGVGDEAHALKIGRATPVGGQVYVAVDEASAVAFVESYRLNALKHDFADLRDRRILALESGTVKRVEVSWPEAGQRYAVVLERDPENVWRLRQPIEGRADQTIVDELLSNLEFLQASGFVDERTPAIESALRETALEVRFAEAESEEGANGAGAGRLLIAGLVDGSRIAESGGRLFRLLPERLDDFPRRLTAYRDKQLVSLEPSDVAKIELEPEGGAKIVLEKTASGWSASGREIDAEAVSGFAETLASLRAMDIVADEMGSKELASLGLAPPAATLRVGDVVLELGRLDPDRGLFVRRAGESTIYVVAAATAEALPRTVADFEAQYGPPPPADAPAQSSSPELSGNAGGAEEAAEADAPGDVGPSDADAPAEAGSAAAP